MENLLVTGGCGFIGTNFIRHLLMNTDFRGRVINVDKLTYAGNPENLADIQVEYPLRYEFIHADICDTRAMHAVFKDYRIDTVCHFAAESHVDRSIIGPKAFIQTNIEGTFNLLEIARQNRKKLRRFHHISTDEVYGSLGPDGVFTEESPYRPNSPYAASKAASDHLVRAYGQTYLLPVTLSNCSNNYGPYQYPEKLIPLVILNALACETLPLYGQGVNVRDWLFVEDHCEAVWVILKHGQPGRTYNIGGRCEMTNLETVQRICALLDKLVPDPQQGARNALITFVKDRPGHDFRYAVDCSRLERDLGWKPHESFESGLKKTIRWYMDHREWVERVRSGEYRRWIKQHYETT